MEKELAVASALQEGGLSTGGGTMQNQFFGDIHDCRKYGILRTLAQAGGLKIGVCWMLTGDGPETSEKSRWTHLAGPAAENPLEQLEQAGGLRDMSVAERWRLFDPVLLRALRDWHHGHDVRRAAEPGILPEALFYDRRLDLTADRDAYFQDMFWEFLCCDLVYLDPDNGFEVASTPRGCPGSEKYLYWEDIRFPVPSLLVRQRTPRGAGFAAATIEKLRRTTRCETVFTFRTSGAMFFLAAQERHEHAVRGAVLEVNRRWAGEISAREELADPWAMGGELSPFER